MTLATAAAITLHAHAHAQADNGGLPELSLLAPVAITAAPESVGSDAATVSGLVTPNGNETSAHFEYGPTPGYGQRTADIAAGSGFAPFSVSGRLSGLTPGAVVHYRLVASSVAGSASGGDRVLVTPSRAGLTPPTAGSRPEIQPPGAPSIAGQTSVAVSSNPRPVRGQATTLAVRTHDPGRPVTGIAVDFGEREADIVASVCERGADGRAPDAGPLARDQDGMFALTYAYRRTGRHRVVIDLFSGTCDRPARRLRRLVSMVDVQPGARTARTRDLERLGQAATTAPSACPDANTAPSGRNARRLERAVRCLVAVERAAHGLPLLRPDRRLTRAARAHNRDMLRRKYLGHAHRRGPSLGARMARVGYAGRAGETIGVGIGALATPRAVVDSWMNSAAHRHVLLGTRYRVIGAAVVRGAPVRARPPKATFVANLGSR